MITPRPGRVGQSNRGPVTVGQAQLSQPMVFPAPIGGLVTNIDIASEAPGNASVLTNWFPTQTGIRIRGGCKKHGIAAGGAPIVRLLHYKFGSVEKLFASTATSIFDMTSPAAPPATVSASVTGQTSGDWSVFQHTNTGGSYLVATNGANARQLFNGTSWTATPAITFTDSTVMADLSYGWLFANREFFVKKNTLDAYYLDVAAIGGAATLFPLGGTMKKGGSLLTGFSWSLESAGSGPTEYCCFVSTEGEVAVFAGTDPSSADSFALQNVYQVGKPLGKNAWLKRGGDVFIGTVDGLVPLSQALTRGVETLSQVSASKNIDDLWRAAALDSPTGWIISEWLEESLIFVAFPASPSFADTTFVMNAITGKWSVIRNWNATCFERFQGALFFGSSGGNVFQGDVTGADDGLPFLAAYLSAFVPSKFGQRITAGLASMRLISATAISVKLFAKADFDIAYPTPADTNEAETDSSTWDAGLWDTAVWDSAPGHALYRFRQNVRASGDFLAVGCVIQSAGGQKLSITADIGMLQAAAGEASA